MIAEAWRLFRLQRAKVAETGFPATLIFWEKRCKEHAERQKGRVWTKCGKERERLNGRDMAHKPSQNSNSEKERERDAHGQDWHCLAWALFLIPKTGMMLPVCISLI